MLEVKIEGATVVDGTGTAGGRSDVGIGGDAIVALGDLSREPAGRTLNASNKVVTPGFIDVHVSPPGSYAATEEIVALARVAARHRGFCASHVGGEGETLLDALNEAIGVGREAGLAVQLSHIEALRRGNWGNVPRALALVDAAVAEGIDVMAGEHTDSLPGTLVQNL